MIKGSKHKQSSIIKIKKSKIGKIQTEESNKKRSLALKGKTYEELYGEDAEHQRKIRSESSKGKIISEEQKKQISETLKRKYKSGEITQANKNKFLKSIVKRRQGYYTRLIFGDNMFIKCNRCDNDAVLVHHKDRNTSNDLIDNLEPLCKSCHSIEHNTGVNFLK